MPWLAFPTPAPLSDRPAFRESTEKSADLRGTKAFLDRLYPSSDENRRAQAERVAARPCGEAGKLPLARPTITVR